MRIALAQVNPTVGDLAGNTKLVVEWIERARKADADIVCFPELVITGYPPEDLVLKPSFVRDNLAQLDLVARASRGIAVVVGFVDRDGDLFNAAAFIHDGEIKAVYHKVFLPNYGVFDEKRYFVPGHRAPIVRLDGVPIGISVCEDCWFPAGPMAWEAEHGAHLLININGSPYHYGKRAPREAMVGGRAAAVLGTRDYMRKQGFDKVVIGRSGGIDSALTAAIACDALGAQNVIGVRMPSRHTSNESLDDAGLVAENLGMQIMDFAIEPPHRGFEEILAPAFKGTTQGVAEENLQPRIRSTILHALSNKFGYIVLSTGNKSELATGYGTLYGDIAGGYSVLKDITKTTVYELCRYRNTIGRAIPERVITKPPSAELKPGQKDTDSLPPYDALDPILIGYIEEDLSPEELVAAGHDPKTVARVIQLVDRSEYKRRQAPPGVKITPRAFGRDRRMPIVNRYSPNGGRPT